jgi:hypothetical protein
MKTTSFIIAILFWNFSNAIAQDDETKAHLRSLGFGASLSVDNRLPALMFKPSADLKFFNGKLVIGGHANVQLLKLEEWDLKILDPKKSLVGNNITRPYSAYEFFGGFTLYGNTNQDATVTSTYSSGRYTFQSREPGSKSYLIGLRGGFGAISSKIGIYAKSFELQSAISSGVDYNRFDKYANTITEYFFIGSNNYLCKKIDTENEGLKNGILLNIYADLIIPTKVYIGSMYNLLNEKFIPIPKSGENWKQIGGRVGFSRKGTNIFGLAIKLETGIMSNFSTYGSGVNSLFFNIDLGIQISPLIGVLSLEK